MHAWRVKTIWIDVTEERGELLTISLEIQETCRVAAALSSGNPDLVTSLGESWCRGLSGVMALVEL